MAEKITITPPPYLPSTLWMKTKNGGRPLPARDYTRTLIACNRPGGMVLTVPVAGGASAVKRGDIRSLEISDHGDWTRIHLGAIEAAYGKCPYFQHLFPEIAEHIVAYPESLALLNLTLLSDMLSFLDYDREIDALESLASENPGRCARIKSRLEAKTDASFSFLQPLFQFGKDAIFLLLDYDKTLRT